MVSPAPSAQSHSRLRAVVFDMDGVLVDSHPVHRLAWRRFLQTLGKNVSDSDLDFVLDGRKRKDILTHFLGPLSEERVREYGRQKDELFWRGAANVVPISGTLELVECIRQAGIVMAVATSASAGRSRAMLTALGLITHFTAIVTGDEVQFGKPYPDIYRIACQRIHCPPEAALAVEDATSGIQAAKAAGLKCVALAGNQSEQKLAAAGADRVFRNFDHATLQEFHKILSGI